MPSEWNETSSQAPCNLSQPTVVSGTHPYIQTLEIRPEIFPTRTVSPNPKDLIGAKKLSMTALPDIAVAHGNHAMMNGSEKYGPYNWRDNDVQAKIYIEACRRHLAQWLDREETAEDSGVHHLGHAIACLAIILDAQENEALIDDRPLKAGGFNRVLNRLNKQIKERSKS